MYVWIAKIYFLQSHGQKDCSAKVAVGRTHCETHQWLLERKRSAMATMKTAAAGTEASHLVKRERLGGIFVTPLLSLWWDSTLSVCM
jgi:hypothetical protein